MSVVVVAVVVVVGVSSSYCWSNNGLLMDASRSLGRVGIPVNAFAKYA